MATVVWHMYILLLMLILVCGVAEQKFRSSYETVSVEPPYDEEYIHHIYSMYDVYRGDLDELIVETNAQIDTKYRTWKRNVDLINTILGMPKGLNQAGR